MKSNAYHVRMQFVIPIPE